MKRKKGVGIFGKIFLYTLVLLALTIFTLSMFFGNQVVGILDHTQTQFIQDGTLLTAPQTDGEATEITIVPAQIVSELYADFVSKTIVALIIVLIAGTALAAVFAYTIATPVKKLAADTAKMSKLELVSTPTARRDEIGQLSNDVYKMYETLKLEIEREKEMEENQRYFFSAVSHELKTPIAATSCILEGMIANVIEPSEYPAYLHKCLNMVTSQSKLISEMLEIIRLSDTKIEPKSEIINLHDNIQSILPTYQTLAEAREQTITLSVPDTLICMLDPNIFNRALSNVIMNSVQNAPEQGEICIYSEEKNQKTVRLYISNSNTHIDEGNIPKLFDPFYRADKARSRNQNRSGLGLTIVKKSLDLMGIPFSLENMGESVVFWMDLPL